MQQTLTELILKFLKDHPDKKYKARELAEELIKHFPDYLAAKKKTNKSGEALITQIVAEISAKKKILQKKGILWEDYPKPRKFYFSCSDSDQPPETIKTPESAETDDSAFLQTHSGNYSFKEIELYQPLMQEFLSPELCLSCMRISESASRNNLGAGGNKWLHPDIVAMQRLDKSWCKEVKACLGENSTTKIRLWSFEIKKDLTTSNFREAFFQAVSNSSWANEGYLVATSIASNIEDDLRMLSSLHGIGVIVLHTDNFSESEIFLPSRQRPEVDWQSVNRIAEQNFNFKEFLQKVQAYLKSDYYDKNSWNR